MNYKKIFWGLILITAGVLFLLKNLNLLYFSWGVIWRLWPVLLILWGISIIPVKNWLKLLLSVVAILIAFTFVSNRSYYKHETRSHKFFDESEFEDQQIIVPYDTIVTEATLDLDAAAGRFKINKTTADLIDFNKYGSLGNYSITSNDNNNRKVVKIKLENAIVNMGKKSDRVDIKLNQDPVWDFNLDIGAASFNLDLTEFKVHKVDIDGGAASVKIKIGDEYSLVKLKIDAGASSIRINIPELSGCQIKTSTILSSKSFHGFKKIKNHLYQTPDFETKDNKVFIDLDAAVSSLKIIRY